MKLKKLAAAALAAVMSLTMLTGCGGGGGSGATVPTGEVEFHSTRAYQLMQKAQAENLYTEYWVEVRDSQGKDPLQSLVNANASDLTIKQGTVAGNSDCNYKDIYSKDELVYTVIETDTTLNDETMLVVYKTERTDDGYYEEMSELMEDCEDFKDGMPIYTNLYPFIELAYRLSTLDRALFVLMDSTDMIEKYGKVEKGAYVDSTGTYTAEIITLARPETKEKGVITFAYDSKGDLKVLKTEDSEGTMTYHYNVFEQGSAKFNNKKLDVRSDAYNAIKLKYWA